MPQSSLTACCLLSDTGACCPLSALRKVHVLFLHRCPRRLVEQSEQFADGSRLLLGVAPRPGPALDLEVAAGVWGNTQAVEVDKELGAVVAHQPATAIFLDLAFPLRLEVFAVKAQALLRGRDEARPREQHRIFEFALLGG